MRDLLPDVASIGIGTSTEVIADRGTISDRASERWFHALVHGASDLIVVLDVDGKLLYANPAAVQLLGFSSGDAATRDVFAQVHPDDRPRAREEFAAVLLRPGPNAPSTHRFATVDGGWRTVEAASTNCLDDPAVAGIVINGRDVTEHEVLRHALQERVKELTCLAVVNRAAHEMDSVPALGELVAEALCLAMRYPSRTVAVVRIDDWQHGAGAGRSSGEWLNAPIIVAGRQRGDVRVAYTQSAEFLPEEQHLLDAVATTIALWLERHESSAALIESDARFRRLVVNAKDVIFRYRIGDREGFDYLSPSVEDLTGFSAEAFLAEPQMAKRLIGWTLPPHEFGGPDGASDLEPPGRAPAVKLIARDGSERWTERTLVPVHDELGNVVAVEGVGRDVTDRMERARAAEHRAAEQGGLARIAEAALTTDDMTELFDTATALITAALPIDASAVYELDQETGELAMVSGSGWPAGVAGNTRLRLDEAPLAATALSQDAPVVLSDLSETQAEFLAAQGFVDALTVVIGGRGAAFGALGAYSGRHMAFSEDQIEFLQTIAHILAAAIERTTAETALASSERHFRTLAETFPDIVARLDRDHRYLYINPRVESAYGLAPAMVIGKTNHELGLPAGLVDVWEEAYEQVFSTGEPATVEGLYPRGETDAHFQSRLIPEFDSHGNVRAVVCVTRDITELRHSEEQRREGLARIVAAQEEERARIGADIHDDSIQVMTAVGMRLDGLKRQISDPPAMALLGRLEDAVTHSIGRLRALMFELRPPELERDGLPAALGLYLQTTATDGLPLCELFDNGSQELPLELRLVLYRIALEAITNARKHAQATRVEVTLDNVPAGVRLRVTDDGRGFDPAALIHVGPHHVGTATMRERAHAAGGGLELRSAPGEGTSVTVWMPCPQNTSAA